MAALTIAPTADQPTITSGGLGASVLKSALMGGASVGYAREKRTGVAETAPGVAQSSTAALDLTGSTRYRYPGMHADFVAGTASNPGQYMSTNYKPNGSSQNARYLFAVEFVTSSPQVSIRFNAVAANPRLGRIYVNGLPISTNHPAQTVTASAGAGTEVLFTFPSAAVRTIKIIGFNQDEGRFGGVDVATGYTVAKPTAPLGDVLMFLGDSYMGGAGGNASAGANVVETWVWQFADAIGISNVFPDGIGGTGYITDTGGVDNSFDTRAADIAKSGATILVVGGGRNDSTGTGVQAILEGIIDAANTAGVNPVYVTNSTADSQTAVQAAVAAAVASRSKTYIGGFSIDALPKIADGIHMTQAGHATFATNTVAALPAAATTVTGALPLALGATGTALPSSTATGTAPLAVALTGNAVGLSTVTGSLPATLGLAGSAIGVTAATGSLPTGLGLTGQALLRTSASGTLPVAVALAGVAVPAVNGALPIVLALTGVAKPVVTGTLPIALGMSGAIAGVTPTATGTMPLGIGLTGTAVARTTTTGTLPMALGMAGSASSSSTRTGALAVGLGLTGTATSAASPSATGAMSLSLGMVGTAVARATVTGALPLQLAIVGVLGGGRDITVTIGSPQRNPFTAGSPTRNPLRIRSPWR